MFVWFCIFCFLFLKDFPLRNTWKERKKIVCDFIFFYTRSRCFSHHIVWLLHWAVRCDDRPMCRWEGSLPALVSQLLCCIVLVHLFFFPADEELRSWCKFSLFFCPLYLLLLHGMLSLWLPLHFWVSLFSAEVNDDLNPDERRFVDKLIKLFQALIYFLFSPSPLSGALFFQGKKGWLVLSGGSKRLISEASIWTCVSSVLRNHWGSHIPVVQSTISLPQCCNLYH